MKRQILILITLFFMASAIPAMSNESDRRTSGIILRGTYWQTATDGFAVTVSNNFFDETVSVGSYGGWIFFFSQIGDKSYLECGLGSIGQVQKESNWFESDEVNVEGMVPLTFGLRYHLLPVRHHSALQPYVTAGGGPCWKVNVNVLDRFLGDEEVSVKSKVKPGMYAGCGVGIELASWFVLDFDMKYHLVGFDFDDNFSGFEFGMGLGFVWGQ